MMNTRRERDFMRPLYHQEAGKFFYCLRYSSNNLGYIFGIPQSDFNRA